MAMVLNRRAMLRGIGGAAVGLPLLEAMMDGPRSARAAESPRRYMVFFTGTSLGGGGSALGHIVPDTLGPGYDPMLKTALAPLGSYGVAGDVAVVSGLRIPMDTGSGIPSGGRSNVFHGASMNPQLAGVRTHPEYNRLFTGPTSDQLVAQAIAGDTAYPSLAWCVQASCYVQGYCHADDGVMSCKAIDGELHPVVPTVSPQQGWLNLFSEFVPTDNPELAKEKDFRLRLRRSIVDLVRGNAETLVKRLGGSDRQRIERHLDEIRDLEKRIDALPPVAGGQCLPVADPGADPPVGADAVYDGASCTTTYQPNDAYGGENERARVICDLIHMALVCDRTRVAVMMITQPQSFMNMLHVTGLPGLLHGITHYEVPGDQGENVAITLAWHIEHFAYLVDKLRSTPEGDGTVLDSSALVFTFEGGWGFGDSGDDTPHSTENMVCLVAGRAGGLQAGHHIVADGHHPAEVLITAMNAVGVPTDTLGEVSGEIPGLRV